MNPWGLTPHQAALLNALCATGSTSAAAGMIGIRPTTARERMKNVRSKMGNGTALSIAVRWTRWQVQRGLS